MEDQNLLRNRLKNAQAEAEKYKKAFGDAMYTLGILRAKIGHAHDALIADEPDLAKEYLSKHLDVIDSNFINKLRRIK